MKTTKLRHARGLATAAKMDSRLGETVTQPDQYGDSAPATPTGGRDHDHDGKSGRRG